MNASSIRAEFIHSRRKLGTANALDSDRTELRRTATEDGRTTQMAPHCGLSLAPVAEGRIGSVCAQAGGTVKDRLDRLER